MLVLLLSGCADAPHALRWGYRLQLRFPVAERERISSDVMGFDHDPEQYTGLLNSTCTNFEGESFPYCYDSHDGTDFTLIGGFAAMDDGSAAVVAAADGEVDFVVDHHYDRCHFDVSTFDVSCDGHEMAANRVRVVHANGYVTVYKHLMQDSAMVKVGDVVRAGDPLGLIGSSGYSTAPHLHIELRAPDGTDVDPYAGPYSQERSWWCGQDEGDGLPASDCP